MCSCSGRGLGSRIRRVAWVGVRALFAGGEGVGRRPTSGIAQAPPARHVTAEMRCGLIQLACDEPDKLFTPFRNNRTRKALATTLKLRARVEVSRRSTHSECGRSQAQAGVVRARTRRVSAVVGVRGSGLVQVAGRERAFAQLASTSSTSSRLTSSDSSCPVTETLRRTSVPQFLSPLEVRSQSTLIRHRTANQEPKRNSKTTAPAVRSLIRQKRWRPAMPANFIFGK